MSTFSLENFGCRATQADAAALESQLRDLGLAKAADHSQSDVVVLHTCTVTASADRQARETIRKIHRENPRARLLVTGCYAQRAPEEIAGLEGVAWVVGNSHQAALPGVVAGLLNAPQAAWPPAGDFYPLDRLGSGPFALPQGPAKILTGDIFALSAGEFAPAEHWAEERTRATLKIQDGCNNRCSFCVIPFVRGRSRSLPAQRAVAEIARLVEAGYREIVLSGINLGSYGRDLEPRVPLPELVRRILDETPLERLRFSSIEPLDVTGDFVDLVATSQRIAPHFHMPLQSGSDRILRAMCRWYRAEHYARRAELIRERLPHAAIGADVIAGFPGENDADHRATLELIRRLPFSYLHIFSFSARPGTRAHRMENHIPQPVIQRRARELRALAAEKNAAFRASQAGRTLRLLSLHRAGKDWTEALSENYLRVRLAGRWPANRWFDARFDPSGNPVPGQPVAP